MRMFLVAASFAVVSLLVGGLQAGHDPAEEAAKSLAREIMTKGRAYGDLAELLAKGPRLSGTAGATRAIEWAKAKMESYGFEKVTLQPFSAPAWERGKVARAEIVSTPGRKLAAKSRALRVVALGNSVGTPAGGLEGEVVELQKIEDADAMGDKLKGKIVLFNRPMDPALFDTFSAYGGAVNQRSKGASRASKAGAIAVLVRSMTLRADGHPHTGGLWYSDDSPKIPAAAITTEDADRLSALVKAGSVRVKLALSAKPLPSVESHNVYGQITGSEKPGEVIVVAGHLDTWDLSPGAHDDGAGVVQTLEAVRAFKALGLKPKRTIRAVLYMSEEFGGVGGKEYAKQAKLKGEKHYAAMESDRGGFTPRGFTVEKGDSYADRLRSWNKYLAPLGAGVVEMGESGTDVEPLGELGTALFGYLPDSQRYFDYHHSDNDVLDAVNPRELALGAASMAVLTYLLSEKGL